MNLQNVLCGTARAFLLIAVCLVTPAVYAQNVAINADGSLPDKHAMLDIKSPNKGVLMPRITTEARMKIPNTRGMLVYDINTHSFWYNTGRQWLSLAESSNAWLLTGNAGTVDTVNFLGTTDNVPLTFKVNNERSGRIDHLKENTFFGFRAGTVTNNAIETGNTALGHYSLAVNYTGVQNTATGGFSMKNNSWGAYNTANGYRSLTSNIGGSQNVAVGFDALHNNAYGSGNTAIGAEALYLGTTSGYNAAVGFASQYTTTVGGGNSSLGAFSLYNNYSGSANVAIGQFAMYGNSAGSQNIGIGNQTMMFANGSDNTAVGYRSMIGIAGTNNASFGAHALRSSYAGDSNTAIGTYALYTNESGSNNTALGSRSMINNVTGSGNTTIGQASDVSARDLTNATAIGFATIVNASNKVRIGNASVTVIEGQVPFTTPSDGRFKFNVHEDVSGLDFILQLRPVTYQFDTKKFDGTGNAEAIAIRRSGFIAQEVEEAARKSGYNFSGIITPRNEQDHYGLSYESFVVPLVKGMQEQQQVITDQQRTITELKAKLDKIEKLLESITNKNHKP